MEKSRFIRMLYLSRIVKRKKEKDRCYRLKLRDGKVKKNEEPSSKYKVCVCVETCVCVIVVTVFESCIMGGVIFQSDFSTGVHIVQPTNISFDTHTLS